MIDQIADKVSLQNAFCMFQLKKKVKVTQISIPIGHFPLLVQALLAGVVKGSNICWLLSENYWPRLNVENH